LLDQQLFTGIRREWSWPALIDRASAGDGLALEYQPIVDMQRAVVAGYEALARFTDRPDLSPDTWFAEARRQGRAAQLDAAVLRAVLARRPTLPTNRFLTVNVEPASLLAPDVERVLHQVPDLGAVVVEITEHSHIDDLPATKNAIERLRRRGARIALDDAGTGYAGLEQILDLRPDLLKVDRALVAGIEWDEAKAALVEMVGAFADRIDAWILVEGIETEEAARRCARLGVPLAQGWFFGRPQAGWSDIEPAAFAALADLLDTRVGDGLQPLLLVAPTVHITNVDVAATVLAASAADVVVVVGDNDRPLGLLTAESGLARRPIASLVANVCSTPAELAYRLSTVRAGDAALPTVVADSGGRYVGIVTLQRLMAYLADVHARVFGE